jgi:large subunit ribosomal protein L32
MAVPKGKTSRMKKNMRRSHDALAAPARSKCPQCGAAKTPHRVCATCGTYKGREILKIEDE